LLGYFDLEDMEIITYWELLLRREAPTGGAILAVLIPFAMPSPNIGSPRITPRTGTGTSMTAKFMFAKAIRPDMAKVVPPAASSPATRNDPYFHDTANAAVASTIAPMPSTGASPGPAVRNSARPPIALVRKKASEAAASPPDYEF
jgi:hypothetical protein